MDAMQHALGAEVRALVAAATPRLTAKAVYTAAGISSSAYSNYFVQCTRDVPVAVVADVARVLGIPASELLRRAEERAAEAVDPSEAELLEGMAPHVRRELEGYRRNAKADPGSAERTSRKRRSG